MISKFSTYFKGLKLFQTSLKNEIQENYTNFTLTIFSKRKL